MQRPTAAAAAGDGGDHARSSTPDPSTKRRNNPYSPGNRSSTMHSSKSAAIPLTTLITVIFACAASFYAGTLWALHAGIGDCSGQTLQLRSENNILRKLMLEQEKAKEMQEVKKETPIEVESYFPQTMSKFAVATSRVTKPELMEHIDIGVSLDLPSRGDRDALIIYNQQGALPTNKSLVSLNSMNMLSVKTALENCDYLNVILTTHDHARKQCIAIVPQYEAFHMYRLARVPPYKVAAKAVDHKQDLRLVSRAYDGKGKENFLPPTRTDTVTFWETLQRFLASLDTVLTELKPILSKIARDNTVIVMVCNFGQSELLMNFVCAAKSRGFDLSMVIVFATDEETLELATSLGLTAYYDSRNFDVMPKHEANNYGDKYFVQMMFAKAMCVTFVSMLGYDFLFSDVDIVWYRHPLDWFQTEYKKFNDFDMFFQDDGGHSQRYAPLSANSGFYYVKASDRTRYLITTVMMSGDMILKTDSHQQALIARINEYASLLALKVKIISRDDEELPGGYHYHQKSGKYLREFFNGEKHPVIFHMSWTKNKDNKLLFMRQMGEWFVSDHCIQKSAKEIIKESPVNPLGRKNAGTQLEGFCCSAEPIFSCHYRDKPSIKPCKDSPPIDEGKPSWWK